MINKVLFGASLITSALGQYCRDSFNASDPLNSTAITDTADTNYTSSKEWGAIPGPFGATYKSSVKVTTFPNASQANTINPFSLGSPYDVVIQLNMTSTNENTVWNNDTFSYSP